MIRHLIAAFLVIAFATTATAETTPPADAAPAAIPAAPPAPPAPAQPAAPAPAARREEVDGQQKPGLAARIRAALTRNADTASLQTQLATITRERDELRTQLATVTAERDASRADIATVEQLLAGERDIVRATAREITQTVGIPVASLPAPVAEHTGEHVFDQWLAATGSAKSALYREHKGKIRAEAARRGHSL